jgi:AraC-like DNA-binding protein
VLQERAVCRSLGPAECKGVGHLAAAEVQEFQVPLRAAKTACPERKRPCGAIMKHNMVEGPLASFPAIRSSSIEEVREAVVRCYGARRFDVAHNVESFDVSANHWQSQNIGLSYCSYGAPVQLEFPEANFFRQQICLRSGSALRIGQIERPVTNDETCIVPPETAIQVAFAADFEQLVLRIEANSLMNKLAALIGRTPSRKLVFDQARNNAAAVGKLRRMLTFFAGELDSMNSETDSLAVAELEQALIVAFICNNPHNYSAFLHDRTRPAASWQVRRAEEYIEAHWNQPITIEELARITSTSARSLFHQFRRSRGQSPMGFVKEVRLGRARLMFQRLDLHHSVTEIALACGFMNLGHFARDYFKRFGERPSDTLKRHKAESISHDNNTDLAA